MDALLQAIADPGRRILLDRLRQGPASVNDLAALLPISRPGVSKHLRVLRDAGLVTVRPDAQRRLYALEPEPMEELDRWLGGYRTLWTQRMDALHTEIARGKRERREGGTATPTTTTTPRSTT